MKTGRPHKPLTIDGQQTTISQLAQRAGVSRHVMYQRLRRGPADQAILGPLSDRNVPRKHAYKGQMLDKYELSALAGCSPRLMRQRLAKMGAEAAVDLGPPCFKRPKDKPMKTEPKPRGFLFEHAGQMLTVKQLAELARCSVDTIHARLKRGMSASEAVVAGVRIQNHDSKAKQAQREKLKAHPVKPVRSYFKLEADTPVICNVQPVVIPHAEDHRHTFIGEPGRWVDSSQCRPWAASFGG